MVGGTVEMADFSELLSKRRSIRDYEDRVVSLDFVKEIIRDSCFAPNLWGWGSRGGS